MLKNGVALCTQISVLSGKVEPSTSVGESAKSSVNFRQPPSARQPSKRLSLPGNMLLPSFNLTQQPSLTSDQHMSRRMRRASLVCIGVGVVIKHATCLKVG